jgi:hypothetical protein
MKTPPPNLAEMSAVDLIKFLNGVRGWHACEFKRQCALWINLQPKPFGLAKTNL